MKRLIPILLVALMLLQTACAAVPKKLLSSDDVMLTSAESSSTTSVYTNEYAFVRGGADWKDKNWHEILASRKLEDCLIVKNGHINSSTTRHMYLKFDISNLTVYDVGKAELAVKFTKIEADLDVPFNVYLVSSNWQEDSITYSTQPAKINTSPIASNVILNNEKADVTSALHTMLQQGEKTLTLLIVQPIETISETRIEFSKLAEGEMPHLIIDSEGAPTEATPIEPEEDPLMKKYVTTEYAYVRGGTKWKDSNWHTINAENNTAETICIKNSLGSGDASRRAFFRFDLTGLNVLEVGYAELFITFSSIQKDPLVHFDVYLVDDNWNENSVTWNTQPKKLNNTPLLSDVVFGTLTKVDATEFVQDMLFDEKPCFTIMLVQTTETEGVSKIYASASAGATLPQFRITKEKPSTDMGYTKQIVSDEKENQAIWDYAKKMYDEWYARYLVVKEKPLGNPALIESDKNQFDKTVMSPGSNPLHTMNEYPTRTVDSLTDLSKYVDINKETKLDRYGGIIDPEMRQESTGYFYTTKINGRWWVIDPLGYPCLLKSVSGVTTAYRQSPNQKAAFLEKFGTSERWAIATTRHLMDDLGFNCTSTSDNSIYQVVDGLTYFKRFSAMINYSNQIGINATEGGQARFSENNTMPVFDPEFESYVDAQARSNAEPENRDIIAYITDNELPMDLTMLRDYLTIDPYKSVNRYSYACAWYWVTQMTGKESVSDSDLTNELMDLFRGFIWDRYLYVVSTAIDKYDPNHLYAGTKYLNWSKESEWVLRFSAEYVDILTINWYSAWEPQAEYIYAFARYANVPFMVTEFYAKSSDTYDNLASKDGAGFYVKTQADRGLFYQNYTLRLLEAKNCVGWQWFQYTDNDPAANATDTTSRDSNKGIVNNRHEEYTELTDDMIIINKNAYKLIEYFDAKYAE